VKPFGERGQRGEGRNGQGDEEWGKGSISFFDLNRMIEDTLNIERGIPIKRWRYVATVLSVLLCLSNMAMGNEMVIPVVKIMGLSISLTIIFIIIAVLLIFVVESVVLYARLRIRYIEALALSVVANSFSTLIGGVSVWIGKSATIIRLLYTFLCACSFAVMLGFFIRDSRLGRKQGQEKVSWLSPLLIILGIAVALFVFLVNFPDFVVGYIGNYISNYLGVYIFYITVGFILTIISEGFVVGRWMSERSSKIFSTVFIINVISYLLLFFLLWILTNWTYGNRP